MSDAGSLDTLIENVVKGAGWSGPRTSAGLLASWEYFVAECETGYDMSIYEYENDRAVRGMIEAVLSDQEVGDSPLVGEFRGRVAAADDRLKKIFLALPSAVGKTAHWWEEGVPRYAGLDLASDFEQILGIAVDVVKR